MLAARGRAGIRLASPSSRCARATCSLEPQRKALGEASRLRFHPLSPERFLLGGEGWGEGACVSQHPIVSATPGVRPLTPCPLPQAKKPFGGEGAKPALPPQEATAPCRGSRSGLAAPPNDKQRCNAKRRVNVTHHHYRVAPR